MSSKGMNSTAADYIIGAVLFTIGLTGFIWNYRQNEAEARERDFHIACLQGGGSWVNGDCVRN
jgi:hypothetical protein